MPLTTQRIDMITNSFDDKALSFGDKNREFLFEWRPYHRRQKTTKSQRTLLWIAGVLFLVAAACMFWLLFNLFSSSPEIIESLKTFGWHSLKQRQIFQITVELPIYFLGFITLLWLQRRSRRSRLLVNQSHMQHISGLPLWLARLLKQNWTLSLDDVRSSRIRLTLAGSARAQAPLAWFYLTCHTDADEPGWLKKQLTLQRLVPANWFLIDEPAREAIQAPAGLFWRSLNPWKTPAGQALLQKTFDQLSLIAALRTHGVTVSMINTVRQNAPGGSFDLMAYPRIKAVVLSFFGLLAAAGVMHHLMRHQHFFDAPAISLWAAFGGLCAMASWWWLHAEQAPAESSFKLTQILIAALFGVAATLAAPSALLAVNQLLGAPQLVAVAVKQAPLQIIPDDQSIPPFSPSHAMEFWAERGAQPGRQITVCRGLFGMWQYDSEPLEEEVWAFYKTYNDSARPPGK